MDRIERIRQMEALLDECSAAVSDFGAALEKYRAAQAKIAALSKYYGSRSWHADRRADERGLLPEDLRRGVLSEDLVYDVITGNRDNALDMLDDAAAILRRL